jgi:hypothetical protein
VIYDYDFHPADDARLFRMPAEGVRRFDHVAFVAEVSYGDVSCGRFARPDAGRSCRRSRRLLLRRPVVVRIGIAVATLFSGAGLLAYLAMLVFVPADDASGSAPSSATPRPVHPPADAIARTLVRGR